MRKFKVHVELEVEKVIRYHQDDYEVELDDTHDGDIGKALERAIAAKVDADFEDGILSEETMSEDTDHEVDSTYKVVKVEEVTIKDTPVIDPDQIKMEL